MGEKKEKRQLTEIVSQEQSKRANEFVIKEGGKEETTEHTIVVTSERWRQGTSKKASWYVSERVNE